MQTCARHMAGIGGGSHSLLSTSYSRCVPASRHAMVDAVCTLLCDTSSCGTQAMLVGLTLPLYSVHASSKPWHPVLDGASAAGCLLGALRLSSRIHCAI